MSKSKYYLLIVSADTNDADYVTQETKVTVKDLEFVKKVVKVIKKKGYKYQSAYHWGFGEACDAENDPKKLYIPELTEHEIEVFEDKYVPPGHDYGVHSLHSITLLEVASSKALL